MKPYIGLHLRVLKNLDELVEQAERLGLLSFQCFLVHQVTKKRLVVSASEYQRFLKKRQSLGALYAHGAYWINVCGSRYSTAFKLLRSEVAMAQRLGFSHYILHPGSAKGRKDRNEGFDCLARALNDIAKDYKDITIVLENTTHAGDTIGSDLQDFVIIREKLDYPEAVKFCIDTAHAHGFGYDIVSKSGQEQFLATLEQTIGTENIALIHLNDSNELAGMLRDQHVLPGAGKIGADALQAFINEPRLKNKPIILELPDLYEEEELQKYIALVSAWRK